MDIEDIRIYNSLEKESADFICFLIRLLNVKKVLEIGSGSGYSSIKFSKFCDVVTIESDNEKIELVKTNLNKFNVNNVKLIEGDALVEITKLKGRFDLLFIDARKKDYLNYLILALPKLNKDALIIADNTVSHKEKLKEYLDYVNKNYDNIDLNIGKGLCLNIKQHN